MKQIFFLLLLSNSFIFSQIITVYDSLSMDRIEGVKIFNEKFEENTDEIGNFNISKLAEIDSIYFVHFKYDTLIASVKYLRTRIKVLLKPRIFKSKEILIEGEKNDLTAVDKKIFLQDLEKVKLDNVGYLLKQYSFFNLRDYGGLNSLKILSMRGMSSENTTVLFNEIRVNNLMTGIFDFSALNSNLFDEISIKNSIDFNNAISTPGGIVNLNSNDQFFQRFHLTLKTNSELLKSLDLFYSSDNNILSMKSNIHFSQSKNNYKFNFKDQSFERNNADFIKTGINTFLSYENKFNISLFSNILYLESGIPGYVVSNNISSQVARNETFNVLNIIKYNTQFSDESKLTVNLSHNYQLFTIKDPRGDLLVLTNKNIGQLNDIIALSKYETDFNKFNLISGFEYNYSQLSQNNSNKFLINDHYFIKRNSYKLFNSLKFKYVLENHYLNDLGINAFFNFLFSDYNGNKSYLDLGVSISTSYFFKQIVTQINLAKNNRLPTFTEIFYNKLISKTELSPENYFIIEIINSFKELIMKNQNFNLTFFNIYGENKIIWVPSRLAFQSPTNIGKIISRGIEFTIEQHFFNNKLNLFANYTYLESLNKNNLGLNDNSYNKQIIYTPKNKFNINLNFIYGDFISSINMNYVGRTYYTEDNNMRYSLEPTLIIDFDISMQFLLFDLKNIINLSISNLTDNDYFIIQSYPMPKRNFILSYKVNIL